jgi:hypothetical protein
VAPGPKGHHMHGFNLREAQVSTGRTAEVARDTEQQRTTCEAQVRTDGLGAPKSVGNKRVQQIHGQVCVAVDARYCETHGAVGSDRLEGGAGGVGGTT